MAGNVFIVTAPSGAGKTTLVLALLAADPQIQLSVSYTTRSPRDGEENGKDYHFIDRRIFEAMIRRGEFLECAEVHGNYYGTSHQWIKGVLNQDKDILLEIDWQGAQQIRKIFPDSVGIFILPPSKQILEQRLNKRGKDSPESIVRRLANAREEISHVDEFDYVIINALIDEAVRDIISIVRAKRLTLSYQSAHYQQLISELKQ